MIDSMKKVTFLVTDREYDDFIEQLRELGLVHIEQLREGAQSPALADAIALEGRYKAALAALAAHKAPVKETHADCAAATWSEEPAQLLAHVEDLLHEEAKTQATLSQLRKDVARLEPWGEFDPKSVAHLAREIGHGIYLFRCPVKAFRKEWADEFFAIPVAEAQKMTYFVTVADELPAIEAEHVALPEASLSQLQTRARRQERRLEEISSELAAIEAYDTTALDAGRQEARSSIQLERVLMSDERVAGDVLRLLVGWVQTERAEALTAYLDHAHIYYNVEDPQFDDDVPIHITNNKYSRLFEPILRMYSLPNYHDLDPTVFFAPFFMLFFGLCMGDAGYGLLILIVGLVLTAKGKGDMLAYGKLASWLGGCTVVCGLATATFFGINLSELELFAPLRPYFLNDTGVGPLFGYTPMMVISVVIGLVQVLLGMVLKGCKAVKNYGWPYAVATFSWVVAIVAALALYGLPACGMALPTGVQYVLLAVIGLAAAGIFLYNNPASYKNPALGLLGNIGGGVWATYGMATGLLGDLLSYIRLFALGLTGGVLGGVFNSLALDMTNTMPLVARLPVMVVILLLGHGITFALSMISAFVHPMRLTFVEFFKNADYAGGGRAYEPFKK